MHLKSFCALLLSVASEVGAAHTKEWSSQIIVTDGEGAT